MGLFDIFKRNNKVKEVIHQEEVKKVITQEEVKEKENKNNLLKEYPKIPKTLLEILNKIDGTYYRLYGTKEINYYFFSSDIENGEYPYFLLSSRQILNSKNKAVKVYDYFITRKYDDIPVSDKITNDINNVKWLQYN